MTFHPSVARILELLKTKNAWFETFEHEPVRTSEEAARTRPGYTLQQGAKAIVVRIKRSESEKRFLMLVFPADLRFDNAKVKTLFGAKDVRFASEDEVAQLTNGVQPGAVPPFGNLFGLDVVADPAIFQNEKIVFNAGDRCFSVAMKSADYRSIVNPQVSDIVRLK
ncbi:MAG TPA: YbaK/EbsC family protein [Terriglobia bacterium]|jgi:prolyl-tRNA editing enzyme YbaK/EbsC (Cys-tRNA(Pro) deacylase)|nr:YbaK/EbsC family protein [Terriglobia bacterium]